MVAICVRSLGQKPVECNARSLLFKAHAALERAAFVECGCLLREAVRIWLEAECRYHDCLPKTKKPAPPRVLAKALVKAGELDKDMHEWVVEVIEMGNQAAHLVFVRPSLLECGITMTLSMLDGSPYLIQPKAAGRLS